MSELLDPMRITITAHTEMPLAAKIYTGRPAEVKMDPYSTLSDRAKELIAEVHAEQAQVRATQIALDDECRKQITAWKRQRREVGE